MKHIEEITRELCWNPTFDDAYDYLISRSLEVTYEDIETVHSVVGNFIDLAYHPNPYEDRNIVMNDFVDSLEEMVWERYSQELLTL